MKTIQVSHLSKHFGTNRAVDDVSFSVSKGEVIGFVGLNGAGKTTTISLLLGSIKPTSGQIKLFGQPMSYTGAHRFHQHMGYVSGDMALFDKLTGAQYLRFMRNAYPGDHMSRFEELCKRFEPELGKKISDLSRGNRQKIALIAAFQHQPKLVLLDEPTSGLDPLMQSEFLDLVREEAAKGTTVFMSSHYLQEVVDVCTRVLLMKTGQLVKDIDSTQLRNGHGKLVTVTATSTITLPTGATHVTKTSQ